MLFFSEQIKFGLVTLPARFSRPPTPCAHGRLWCIVCRSPPQPLPACHRVCNLISEGNQTPKDRLWGLFWRTPAQTLKNPFMQFPSRHGSRACQQRSFYNHLKELLC